MESNAVGQAKVLKGETIWNMEIPLQLWAFELKKKIEILSVNMYLSPKAFSVST